MKNNYYSIGVMSGTSLDGLDIVLCRFEYKKSQWTYEMLAKSMISYTDSLKKQLIEAHHYSAIDLKILENDWTTLVAQEINTFIKKNKSITDSNKIDAISWHGHTIFHQPEKQLTLQIGNGAMLAALTGLKVINDFRQTDVALGGQGAPLVPIGDKLLFEEYTFCLNLGGIANISFDAQDGQRRAYDITVCNMLLNHLTKKIGLDYDKGGQLARKGAVQEGLLQTLNQLDFYELDYPKSLGREWVEKSLLHLFDSFSRQKEIEDALRTSTVHIAQQLSIAIKKVSGTMKQTNAKPKVLITGGGAFNDFLIEELQNELPDYGLDLSNQSLIDFKEALIFAFLGVLRLREECNTLSSVTGARKSSCGGTIYLAETT